MRPDPKALLLDRRIERIDQVVGQRLRSLTLVLEGVHDPHNLAAVLRTAEGLGLQEVQVVEAPSGFRPNAAITQGADKWLDVRRHASPAACAEALRQAGYRLYASMLSAEAVALEALPFGERLALVLGNEHDGVSPEMAAHCDGRFRIPMYGFTQSFNVSVAAAITLHAAVEARRKLRPGGDLPEGDREALRSRFYALAVKQGRRLAGK